MGAASSSLCAICNVSDGDENEAFDHDEELNLPALQDSPIPAMSGAPSSGGQLPHDASQDKLKHLNPIPASLTPKDSTPSSSLPQVVPAPAALAQPSADGAGHTAREVAESVTTSSVQPESVKVELAPAVTPVAMSQPVGSATSGQTPPNIYQPAGTSSSERVEKRKAEGAVAGVGPVGASPSAEEKQAEEDGGAAGGGRVRSRSVDRNKTLNTFNKVMQGKGLKVLKHARNNDSRTDRRTIFYQPDKEGGVIYWESKKRLFHQPPDVPIKSIDSVEVEGKTVWVHAETRGKVGFETKEPGDAQFLGKSIKLLVSEAKSVA